MRSTAQNLSILYEDNHLVAINKRAGDLVQGDKTGDIPLADHLKEYIGEKYNKPGAVFLGVIHRLDRPTSGVVIFARTSKALGRMNALFASREAHKTYWALVEGTTSNEKGRLQHFLKRNPKQNKSYAHQKAVPDSKKAILSYRTIQKFDRYSLLEIDLETGRHHQIRCQLAAIGHPIKGDLKYGAARSNKDGGIHLHARRLAFTHPVRKEPICIKAPLPKDTLWDLVSKA